MLLVSVYDKKAKAYTMGIGLSSNTAVATRDFSQVCTNPETNLNKFPEDYELHCLGEFNQETGMITQKDIKVITTALNFAEQKNKKEAK